MIQLLDLVSCADTIIGSKTVRGISGGQRRRVSIGEVLLTSPRVLCGDEVTAGLDAAVAEGVVHALRQYATATRATVVLALQAPTPDTYALFDNVVLLGEGHVVYAGSRDALEANLTSRNFPPPAFGDFADWLAAFVTDPVLAAPQGMQPTEVPTLEELSTTGGPSVAWFGSLDQRQHSTAGSATVQVSYTEVGDALRSSEYLTGMYGVGARQAACSRLGATM